MLPEKLTVVIELEDGLTVEILGEREGECVYVDVEQAFVLLNDCMHSERVRDFVFGDRAVGGL